MYITKCINYWWLALIALLLLRLNIFAQDTAAPDKDNPSLPTVLIADSSSTGTYATLIGQLKPFLSDQLNLHEVTPDIPGATHNFAMLLNNQAQLAVLHQDVYVYNAKQDPSIKDKFQVVSQLYPEEVHFLALAQSKRTVGGGWLSKGTPLLVKEIDDLQGLNVGAAGGGVITSQVIKFYTGIGYNFTSYKSGDEVLAALNSGEIDAAVFVGGQPMTNLQKLDNRYKFLSISDDDLSKMNMVYRRAKLNTYSNITDEITPTIAVDCVVVGRVVTVPKFVAALSAFRSDLDNHLAELQQTTGTHPKWSEVQPSSMYKSDLPFMQLPGTLGPVQSSIQR